MDEPSRDDVWAVYVLASHDLHRTYVGITTDLDRRLQQHNGGLPGGARSTRAGRPWSVVASTTRALVRSEALLLEYSLKRLRRPGRLALTEPVLSDLLQQIREARAARREL